MPALRSGAHPRSRGENVSQRDGGKKTAGSSPLTRGKRRPPAAMRRPGGLIPAHAGKTIVSSSSWAAMPAHPRSRGENLDTSFGGEVVLGSSPLTRGKRLPPRHRLHADGLIPAHAGKTQGPRRSRRRCPAHPRSRGENPSQPRSNLGRNGSSPLTRGKREQGAGPVVRVGLIPAHAGKTLVGCVSARPHGAHPRSRGENCRCSD